MSWIDLARLIAIILGCAAGYGTGRYLWSRRRLSLSPWPIIGALVVLGLVSMRAFSLFGLYDAWQAGFFPLVVGWGAGLAVMRR